MNTPDFMPTLSRGGHRNAEQGACVMEYVSFITGDKWTDRPACTPLSLSIMAQRANDFLYDDDERARLMLPLMPRLIGLGQNVNFDRRIADQLTCDAQEHLAPFLDEHDTDAVQRNTSLSIALGRCAPSIGRGYDEVVSAALDALIHRRFHAALSHEEERAEWGHYYHERLLWALDEYDKYVGRDKVEDLTEEQVTKVRTVHDLITA